MDNLVDKNESVLTAFVQEASNLKWIADINDNLVYVNQSFLDYFHVTKEIVSKNITEVFPREVADVVKAMHQKVRIGKKPLNTNVETINADGSINSLVVHSFVINETINPALVAAEATDISEKIKPSAKVDTENLRLHHFDRNSSEAMWEWNILTGTIYRSKQLHDVTGYQFDQSKDLYWWFSQIHQRDRDRVQHSVAAALENRQPSWEEEYQFQCGDGSFKALRDRGFILYENNRPTKMFGFIQDISEIANLKHQLLMEKLRHQKEIAETMIAAQERERVNLGNELHDNINQIITTVRLYLDMIQPATAQDQELKDKTGELVAMAYDEIRKLSRDLVSPQLKADSIIDGVKELIADIENSGKYKVTFEHDQTIWVNRNLKISLFRIAQEQFKNIVRYSEASEINVELRVDQENIVLVIADNGKGFDLTANRSGIGLNNINERVKLYNGQMAIQTAPGTGCKITVTIPL